MKEIQLTATIRQELGKQANKHLRNSGFIPAVIYHRGKDTVSLKVGRRDLHEILHTEHGENVVIALTVAGGDAKGKQKERLVMIKEIQHEPVRGTILHIDFHEISLSEKLKVNIPIETKGEPIGVKQDDGVLEHILREIEAECLPTQIPDFLEIEVSELQIGDSRHVKDLAIPPEVTLLSDPELTILIVKPPHVEVVEEVAPEEAVTEPEVLTEKKAEEGEEVAEGKEKKEAGEKPAAEKKPAPERKGAEEAKKKSEAKGE